eukprot:6189461-Pleurochrysis_carterae.AAC.1
MPCKAILHTQESAEVIVTARDTGYQIRNCPEHVPARAAASRTHKSTVHSGACVDSISLYLEVQVVIHWHIQLEGAKWHSLIGGYYLLACTLQLAHIARTAVAARTTVFCVAEGHWHCPCDAY